MLDPLDLQALPGQQALLDQLAPLVRLVIQVPQDQLVQPEQPGHKDPLVRLVLLGIPALPAPPDQLALLAQQDRLVHRVHKVMQEQLVLPVQLAQLEQPERHLQLLDPQALQVPPVLREQPVQPAQRPLLVVI